MSEEEKLPRYMSASDSVAWRIEHNPLLRSTITTIMRLDQAPDPDLLKERIEATTIAFPRLRQRVVEVPFGVSPPVWSDDPHFDLDFHLSWIRLGRRRDDRALLNLAAASAMRAFDRARPLWEWTVVEELEDGGAAMVIKLHHSITDGVGGVALLSQLFDLEREASRRPAADATATDGEEVEAVSLLIESIRHQTSRGLAQIRSATGALAEATVKPRASGDAAVRNLASTARMLAPVRAPMSPVMTKRSPRNHFESFTVALSDLKAAGKRIEGGKLNDAYMTAIAIGLRKYHEAHGEVPAALRVNMPINLRTDSSAQGGNSWAPARFALPLHDGDVDAHMRDIHDVVAEQRSEPALRFANNIAAVLDRLPTPVLTEVFTNLLTCLDFAATNVPGAPIPLFFAGARIDKMETFAPTGGASMNVALLTYQDQATVTLNIDPAAVPDPDVLLTSIRAGFEEVIDPERNAMGRRVELNPPVTTHSDG
jgi:diacylglycerol O-acyltransferase / wax synthase